MPLTLRTYLTALALIPIGFVGGYVGDRIGLPLPYVLGALLLIAILTAVQAPWRLIHDSYRFPREIPAVFIGIIGVTIGAQITWEVVAALPQAIYSITAMILFVPIVQWVNYLIFRKIGKFDRVTAFYSGAAGGLIEATIQGEKAGADIRLLTLQQFLRVILVVTFLPIALSLWYGHPVGSSGGATLVAGGETAANGARNLLMLAATTAVGLALGYGLKMPAAPLVGPLLVGGAVSLAGLGSPDVPTWLLHLAQVVIAAMLGTRFLGMNIGMLLRGTYLATLSVGMMLVLGLLMAIITAPLGGQAVDVLLISFAPGGVAEMAIVALSLNANPAFVTIHHIFRLVLTVFVMGWAAKRKLY